MGCKSGWPEKYRIAFERELRAVVQSVKDDPRAPRWHVLCSYDPRQPKPPNRNGDWKRRLRTALMRSGGGGKNQLIEESLRVGDGVVVEYLAAGNEGSLPFVSEDSGYGMASAASQRIAEEVRRKAAKVRSSPIACNFGGQWWLALDDEVVRLHSALSEWEWRSIRESVRCRQRRRRGLEQGHLGERTHWQLDDYLGTSRRTRVELTKLDVFVK